jgi:CRISPR-associated protein Cas1
MAADADAGLLAVHTPGAQVGLRADALVVTRGTTELLRRPLHAVREVLLFGHVELTAAARDAALAADIGVVFLSAAGRYRGRLVGFGSAAAERRLRQLEALADPQRRLDVARAVVVAKLRNQRAVLQRVRRERAPDGLDAHIDAIALCAHRAESCDDLDRLRGLEGHGAAMYFRGFAAAVTNPAFSFGGRNRRPPRDPINACLSFGYTLLLGRVESAIARVGLDPALGALHEAGRGKPALALDVMEPWRAVVVDRLVLRLINRQQLGPDDFERRRPDIATRRDTPDDPLDLGDVHGPLPNPEAAWAVWLAATGREIWLRETGALWRARHDVPGVGRLMLADLLVRDVHGLAALVEGRADGWQPVAIR